MPGKDKPLEGKHRQVEILPQVLYSVLEFLTLQAALSKHFQCGFQLTLNLAQLYVSNLILLVCKLGRQEKEGREKAREEGGKNKSKWEILEPWEQRIFLMHSLRLLLNSSR